MATIRFRNAQEMFFAVTAVVLVGGGLIAYRLWPRGGFGTASGSELLSAEMQLESECDQEIYEASMKLPAGLSQLPETPTTPMEPFPVHRGDWELPSSLSSGRACEIELSSALRSAPTEAQLATARAQLAAFKKPTRVLLARQDCSITQCTGTLVWLDVEHGTLLGVKRLSSGPSQLPFVTEQWAAAR